MTNIMARAALRGLTSDIWRRWLWHHTDVCSSNTGWGRCMWHTGVLHCVQTSKVERGSVLVTIRRWPQIIAWWVELNFHCASNNIHGTQPSTSRLMVKWPKWRSWAQKWHLHKRRSTNLLVEILSQHGVHGSNPVMRINTVVLEIWGQHRVLSNIKGATMEERTGPYALPKCNGDTRGSVAPEAPGGANVPYYETCTRGTSGYQPLCCWFFSAKKTA